MKYRPIPRRVCDDVVSTLQISQRDLRSIMLPNAISHWLYVKGRYAIMTKKP
jgi:hypothetical protein